MRHQHQNLLYAKYERIRNYQIPVTKMSSKIAKIRSKFKALKQSPSATQTEFKYLEGQYESNSAQTTVDPEFGNLQAILHPAVEIEPEPSTSKNSPLNAVNSNEDPSKTPQSLHQESSVTVADKNPFMTQVAGGPFQLHRSVSFALSTISQLAAQFVEAATVSEEEPRSSYISELDVLVDTGSLSKQYGPETSAIAREVEPDVEEPRQEQIPRAKSVTFRDAPEIQQFEKPESQPSSNAAPSIEHIDAFTTTDEEILNDPEGVKTDTDTELISVTQAELRLDERRSEKSLSSRIGNKINLVVDLNSLNRKQRRALSKLILLGGTQSRKSIEADPEDSSSNSTTNYESESGNKFSSVVDDEMPGPSVSERRPVFQVTDSSPIMRLSSGTVIEMPDLPIATTVSQLKLLFPKAKSIKLQLVRDKEKDKLIRSAVITFKTKGSAKKSFKRVLELLQANPLEEVLKGLLADDQSSTATVLDELLPKEKVDKEEMISAWIEIQRQYAFAPETDEERA